MQTMSRLKKFPIPFFFILSFFFLANLHAQRATRWQVKNQHEKYTEGLISTNISSTLKLISFYYGFEDFSPNENEVLNIEFYSPEPEYFFFAAEEIKRRHSYRMETNPDTSKTGHNFFSFWKTNGLLKRYRIGKSELAVLARHKKDDSEYILPVRIYHTDEATIKEKYKVVFRLHKSISRAQFEVFKGKTANASNLVFSGFRGMNYGGAPLNLEFATDKLKGYEGWCTLKLQITPRGRPTKEVFEIYFYHKDDD